MQASQSKSLYIQVLIAIVLGVALGHYYPEIGVQLNPLAVGFVKLVKMVIAPIIFVTVVVGIGKLSDTTEVGRIGLKAIIYFEILTTLAMLIGLVVGHIIEPGSGLNADPHSLDAKSVAQYTANAAHQTVTDFLLGIIPDSIVGAFARGDILPVLFFAVLFGIALAKLGERGRPVIHFFDEAGAALFGVIALIMRVAPLGAFGAMGFTIAKYGIGSLSQLAWLMACFYLTCALFVLLCLSMVMRITGLRLWPLLRYLKEEFFIVLGTSSSETALPGLMAKLENLGCNRPLVGLVVPLGYAFNLDGTSIYFTMAITFIAQALNIPLSWGDYLMILAVLLLTSKGAAAVTGGGFITLAATLATLNGKVPVAGIVLVLAIDRFMSEARAITNLFGNAVATIFVAWWEGQLDRDRARRVLAGVEVPAPAVQPVI
ncbi:dicarboxylate/amino acid:cation symporter [Rhodovastum atsumiense]|uniref:Dicarboxylate/amino acid:cation symporter n=1 Tax=Rhodovastum atsumiense TaxID=504468 RepID=A0A5M6IWD2_9PROT|nr:dicarboxylate/amino acid:cation symporter [Rhodovastum atsumiense]